jgi:hypothetical protein
MSILMLERTISLSMRLCVKKWRTSLQEQEIIKEFMRQPVNPAAVRMARQIFPATDPRSEMRATALKTAPGPAKPFCILD